MPTHLYCLLASAGVSMPEGVDAHTVAGLVAWTRETGERQIPRDPRGAAKATLEHDGVVGAALLAGVTPVPASLADPYESLAACLGDVERHAAGIGQALELIRGRGEMTTIAAIDAAPPAPDTAGRGRAYLEQLRSLPMRADRLARQIDDALRSFAHATARRVDGGRAAVSHLVDISRGGEYRRAALDIRLDAARITVDGPRAPYSFAAFSPGKGIVSRQDDPGGTILAS